MDGIAITWYAPVQQPLSSCCNERAQKLLRRSAGTVLSDFPVTPPDNKVLVYSGVLCSQRADFAKPVKTAARGRFLGKFAFPITDCLSEHSVPLPLYLLWHYRATTIDGTLNQVSCVQHGLYTYTCWERPFSWRTCNIQQRCLLSAWTWVINQAIRRWCLLPLERTDAQRRAPAAGAQPAALKSQQRSTRETPVPASPFEVPIFLRQIKRYSCFIL